MFLWNVSEYMYYNTRAYARDDCAPRGSVTSRRRVAMHYNNTYSIIRRGGWRTDTSETQKNQYCIHVTV